MNRPLAATIQLLPNNFTILPITQYLGALLHTLRFRLHQTVRSCNMRFVAMKASVAELRVLDYYSLRFLENAVSIVVRASHGLCRF